MFSFQLPFKKTACVIPTTEDARWRGSAYTALMRILLVEDHIELSHWLSKALRDAHLNVECAVNGADADALLHTQDYALVILDLTLPKMDGL